MDSLEVLDHKDPRVPPDLVPLVLVDSLEVLDHKEPRAQPEVSVATLLPTLMVRVTISAMWPRSQPLATYKVATY